MNNLIPTIGLEVHTQVKSRSKIFCRCSAEPSENPNTNVCPVCMGLPGAMPSLNREIAKQAVKAALALNCTVNPVSGFARKNYFYPDLPKGYQITQFRYPIAERGYMILSSGKRIRIRRLHIEEDTGKMIHDIDEETLVDFNRAGIPLIEIVTEPDFESALEAVEYMTRIREILRYAGVSDANMEKGELRGEPNISVRMSAGDELGTKTEIKNLNSLRSIEKGINYEIERQSRIISEGGRVESQTMLFNEKRQEAVPMRKKESASEYRYFIEPDLPDLNLSADFIEEARSEIKELPEERRARLMKEHGVTREESEIITSDKKLADLFENSIGGISNRKRIVNFFIREIPALLNERNLEPDRLPFGANELKELFIEIDSEGVNLNAAQTVLKEMAEGGKRAGDIIEELNLRQTNDDSKAKDIVREALAENAKEVERYKNGEEKLFGVLVGFCMKKARGSVSPAVINRLLKEMLK